MKFTHYIVLATLFLLFFDNKEANGQYSDIPLRAAEDVEEAISIGQIAPELVLNSPTGEEIDPAEGDQEAPKGFPAHNLNAPRNLVEMKFVTGEDAVLLPRPDNSLTVDHLLDFRFEGNGEGEGPDAEVELLPFLDAVVGVQTPVFKDRVPQLPAGHVIDGLPDGLEIGFDDGGCFNDHSI